MFFICEGKCTICSFENEIDSISAKISNSLFYIISGINCHRDEVCYRRLVNLLTVYNFREVQTVSGNVIQMCLFVFIFLFFCNIGFYVVTVIEL